MSARRVIALVLTSLSLVAPGGIAAAQDKPKPSITFSLAATTFKANEDPVIMKGTITPATAPEEVTLRVQKYKFSTETWEEFDTNTKTSVFLDEDTYKFRYKHAPLPKGTYRARAQVQETDDHLAGANPWKKYRVTTRRHR